MSRALPAAVTVNDLLVKAAVEILDEAVAILAEIRDRLPQPPASSEPEQPVQVQEPAPARPGKAAKKTTPKPVKES